MERPRHTYGNRGLSLIESVIYVSLFAMLMLVAMSSLFTTVKAFSGVRVLRDIDDSSVTIMERMTRDIKTAVSVNMAQSVFGTDPGRLVLTTMTASGTTMTVDYYVSGGAIRLRENGVDKGSLVSTKTHIDGVVFHYIANGATIGIKIDLHLTASRGVVSNTEHFYNTVQLRGTY